MGILPDWPVDTHWHIYCILNQYTFLFYTILWSFLVSPLNSSKPFHAFHFKENIHLHCFFLPPIIGRTGVHCSTFSNVARYQCLHPPYVNSTPSHPMAIGGSVHTLPLCWLSNTVKVCNILSWGKPFGPSFKHCLSLRIDSRYLLSPNTPVLLNYLNS